MWWNLNTENLLYNKEVWELFEGLSTWKKWVRDSKKWISIFWHKDFYLLRWEWLTPSNIIEISKEEALAILEKQYN